MRPILILKTGPNGAILDARHLCEVMVSIVDAVLDTAPEMRNDEVVLTSGVEGHHVEGSLHYIGRAYDFRVWNIVGDWKTEGKLWRDRVQKRLDDICASRGLPEHSYQVVYEEKDVETRNGLTVRTGHLHIEFQLE